MTTKESSYLATDFKVFVVVETESWAS